MKRLVIDSSGMVVQQTRFVSQVDTSQSNGAPLSRLDRLLKGEAPYICIKREIGGIGDVLMTTPVVREIKKKYGAIIDYATTPDYLNGALVKVLTANPNINSIVDYRTIDPTLYSLVINLTCPCIAHEVPGAQPINRIDLFAKGAGLNTPIKDPSLEYHILPTESEWATKWLAARHMLDKKILLVNPNSSTSRRDMGSTILQSALVKILKYFKGTVRAVVVVHSDNKTPGINWKTDGVELLQDHGIREIAAVMDKSNLVICPDSALLHMASALHKKTLTLFGPTDPRARINYHPEAVAIWFGQEFACAPCWYQPKCWNGFSCWKRIEDSMIIEAAIGLLDDKPLEYQHYYTHFGSLVKGLHTNTPRNFANSPFEVL